MSRRPSVSFAPPRWPLRVRPPSVPLRPSTPPVPLPLAVPPSVSPRFSPDTFKTALSSFRLRRASPSLPPFLLQQCLRAESFHFSRALTDVVNLLTDGRAPLFLQPFLAGGVSIALAKPRGRTGRGAEEHPAGSGLRPRHPRGNPHRSSSLE